MPFSVNFTPAEALLGLDHSVGSPVNGALSDDDAIAERDLVREVALVERLDPVERRRLERMPPEAARAR